MSPCATCVTSRMWMSAATSDRYMSLGERIAYIRCTHAKTTLRAFAVKPISWKSLKKAQLVPIRIAFITAAYWLTPHLTLVGYELAWDSG